MSINLKKFLERNIVENAGSTLPITYLESVVAKPGKISGSPGDYIQHADLEIKSSIYVHIDAETYAHDKGAEYLYYLYANVGANLRTYAALAIDRNANAEEYATAKFHADWNHNNDYYSLPINGYTDITKGTISPLALISQPDGYASPTTKKLAMALQLPQIYNEITRATLLWLLDTASTSGSGFGYLKNVLDQSEIVIDGYKFGSLDELTLTDDAEVEYFANIYFALYTSTAVPHEVSSGGAPGGFFAYPHNLGTMKPEWSTSATAVTSFADEDAFGGTLSDLIGSDWADIPRGEIYLRIARLPEWAAAIDNILSQLKAQNAPGIMHITEALMDPGAGDNFRNLSAGVGLSMAAGVYNFPEWLYEEYGQDYVFQTLGIDPSKGGLQYVNYNRLCFELGRFADYFPENPANATEAEMPTPAGTVFHEDGAVTYKFSNTTTLSTDIDAVHTSAAWSDPTYICHQFINDTLLTSTSCPPPGNWFKRLGLAAFTTTIDLYASVSPTDSTTFSEVITEAYHKKDGNRKYYESLISPVNYCLLRNGTTWATDPVEVYVDASENYYNVDSVIRSLGGNFYTDSPTNLSSIVSTVRSIVMPESMSESIADNLNYILAAHGTDPALLVYLNEYRRAFPDKSSVTPTGQFYNTFAGILYDANRLVERGVLVKKALVTNPVVKNLQSREVDFTGGTDRQGRTFADTLGLRGRVFNINNSIWSRWTEVIDWDPSQETIFTKVEVPSGHTSSGTATLGGDVEGTEYKSLTNLIGGAEYGVPQEVFGGGQWDYNLIDQGFIFFNYSEALITDSLLCEILDVNRFEKYFGTDATNAAFRMSKAKVNLWYHGQHPHVYTMTNRYAMDGSGAGFTDTGALAGWWWGDFNDEETIYSAGEIMLHIDNTHTEGGPVGRWCTYRHANVDAGGIIKNTWDVSSVDPVHSSDDWIEGDHFNLAVTYLNGGDFTTLYGEYYPDSTTSHPGTLTEAAGDGSLYATEAGSTPIGGPQGTAIYGLTLSTNAGLFTAEQAADVQANPTAYQYAAADPLSYEDFSTQFQSSRIVMEESAISSTNRISSRYGGADLMEDPVSWSYLALRGWSPITFTEGQHPLHLDDVAFTAQPRYNRIVCFEYKKNDFFNAYDARWDDGADVMEDTTQLIEQKNNNLYYTSHLLVEDRTYGIFQALWQRMLGIKSILTTYEEFAEELCSFNNEDNMFNEHFIESMRTRYTSPAEAPWYIAPSLYHIMLDILTNVYYGDPTTTAEAIQRDVYALAPESATLETIQHFISKVDDLMDGMASYIHEDDGGNFDGTNFATYAAASGWIVYGNGTQTGYDLGEDIKEWFETTVTSESFNSASPTTFGAYHPTEVYDNYPLYPHDGQTWTGIGTTTEFARLDVYMPERPTWEMPDITMEATTMEFTNTVGGFDFDATQTLMIPDPPAPIVNVDVPDVYVNVEPTPVTVEMGDIYNNIEVPPSEPVIVEVPYDLEDQLEAFRDRLFKEFEADYGATMDGLRQQILRLQEQLDATLSKEVVNEMLGIDKEDETNAVDESGDTTGQTWGDGVDVLDLLSDINVAYEEQVIAAIEAKEMGPFDIEWETLFNNWNDMTGSEKRQAKTDWARTIGRSQAWLYGSGTTMV